MNKDQAYHQIALACLKSLRGGNNANTEDQVKVLYDTIDSAFNNQFSLVIAELEDAKARLKQIAELDPERHSVSDAQAIIKNHGTAH